MKLHEPTEHTRKTVYEMTASGIPQDGIAAVIEISEPTLRKHYADEIAKAKHEANNSVAQCLFQQAKDGNTAAAIFWLKVRAGWTEKNITEMAGKVGLDVTGTITTIVDASRAYAEAMKGL